MSQAPRSKTGGIVGDLRSAAASDGVAIAYEVVGGGPPVVLLHGGFAGRGSFSRQRSLAERYRLIIPSSRGHDGTGGTLPANYGFDTSEVDDLYAVLDAEKIDRAMSSGIQAAVQRPLASRGGFHSALIVSC